MQQQPAGEAAKGLPCQVQAVFAAQSAVPSSRTGKGSAQTFKANEESGIGTAEFFCEGCWREQVLVQRAE